MSDEKATALRRSTAGAFVIEPDRYLRAASFAGASPLFHATAATTAFGPGLAVTIQALSEGGEPVAHAEVRLVGEQGAAQGLTGEDGRIDLILYGELPETVTDLFVNAHSGYWGLWRHRTGASGRRGERLYFGIVVVARFAGLGRQGDGIRSTPD